MLLSVLSFIVLFLIVALTHEIGHYVWGKRVGIRVLELGIGFGPCIYKRTVNNTIYSLNLIPVLAFVRLAGIDDQAGDEKNIPENEKYFGKSPAQKLKSISAGALMNLALGMLIFSVLAMTSGLPGISCGIDSVVKGSPADKAGLMSGDRIVALNGKETNNMSAVVSFIHQSAGKRITLSVVRNGKQMDISAVPQYDKKAKVGLLGFSPKQAYRKYGFFSGIWAGAEKTATISVSIIMILGQLLIGKISVFDLAGPIGIAQFSGQAASMGLVPFFLFTAFISINLGVVNLLPLPALDGGRIVFVLIEWIRRRPVDIELENKIHQYGLIALLLLLFIVSINDLSRFISQVVRK